MTFRTLDTADLAGKRALVRVDFNVPVDGGKITDDTRLRAALPTIHYLSQQGAKVVLLAHFDRPKGKVVPEMSLAFVAEPLSALLEQPRSPSPRTPSAPKRPRSSTVWKTAAWPCWRTSASTPAKRRTIPRSPRPWPPMATSMSTTPSAPPTAPTPRPRAWPTCCRPYPGLAMQRELEALDAALGNPKKPVIGIVGGSKVSTKLDLLRNLVTKLDYLAIGGGMANTFLHAAKIDVGASLCEPDLADTALEIIDLAGAAGCKLLLPTDVVVAKSVKPGVHAETRNVYDVQPDDLILDAGPETVKTLLAAMDASKTLIWNGPLGVFEVPPFDEATVSAAKHAAQLAKSGKIVAVAGGGDTVSALNHAGVSADMTFVSTAGGAFLEWMEGKTLPGVAALEA